MFKVSYLVDRPSDCRNSDPFYMCTPNAKIVKKMSLYPIVVSVEEPFKYAVVGRLKVMIRFDSGYLDLKFIYICSCRKYREMKCVSCASL